MVPVLVSTCDLEDYVDSVMSSKMEAHFAVDVSNLVNRLCESYSLTEADELIDAALHGIEQKLDDYSPIDMVVEMFIRLIGGYFNQKEYVLNLEYEPVRQTIVITPRIRPKPTAVHTLIDEQKHAESQWDYVPERVRRATQGLY